MACPLPFFRLLIGWLGFLLSKNTAPVNLGSKFACLWKFGVGYKTNHLSC